jgi:hypothetical protein
MTKHNVGLPLAICPRGDTIVIFLTKKYNV